MSIPTGRLGGDGSTAGRIARNSAWNAAGWAMLVIMNIVAIPLMLDGLGQDRYGGYVLVLSIAGPLGLLDFGITDATVKYLAMSLGAGDTQLAQRYIGSSLLFNVAISFLGWCVIAFAGPFVIANVFDLTAHLEEEMRASLVWAASLWGLQQLRQSPTAIVAGLKRYDLVNVGTSVSQLVIVVAGLVSLLVRPELPTFIMFQALAAFAVLLGWLIISSRLLPGLHIRPALDRETFRTTTAFGFWQMLNSSGTVLSQQSQRWFLGIFQTPAITGFFGMCAQLTGALYMIAFRVGQVLLPEVSDLDGRGKMAEARRLVLPIMWVVTSVSAVVFVPLFVFSHDVLRLWVGAEIADAASPALRIMCVGASVGGMFAVPNFYLLGSGKVRWLAILGGTNGILVAGMSWFFIQEWSLTGAALAYAIATVTHVGMLYVMWDRLFRTDVPLHRFLASTMVPLFEAWSVGAIAFIFRQDLASAPGWMLTVLLAGALAVVVSTVLLLLDRSIGGKASSSGVLIGRLRTLLPFRMSGSDDGEGGA